MRLSPITFCKAYVCRLSDKQIISGPFAGMFYVKDSVNSAYFPKIIGSYEREIHQILYALDGQHFDKIIIIGAAEGYYAAGLSRRWQRPVWAYESDIAGQDLLTRLALINGLHITQKPTFRKDEDTQSVRDFILMDVEGEEMKLLDNQRLKAWQQCTILVEVHGQHIRRAITQRSTPTHGVAFFPVEDRKSTDYPFSVPFRWVLQRYWWGLLQEWRSDSIGWLLLSPRS